MLGRVGSLLAARARRAISFSLTTRGGRALTTRAGARLVPRTIR